MSELDEFLSVVVSDCVDDGPERPLQRPRSCANCGAPTNGAWWCSTACKRAEDGDERDDER